MSVRPKKEKKETKKKKNSFRLSSDRQPGIEEANKKTPMKRSFSDMLKKLIEEGIEKATPAGRFTDPGMDEGGRPFRKPIPVSPGNFLAKGEEVKKYMGGGSVHKKKNKMATTKGWGASRKT